MNRRTFLARSVAASASALTGASAASVASRIIDTHMHFYDPSRPAGVPWPEEGSPLYRTVMPSHWQAVAGPVGVRETVVVEASEWLEDNAWILELAAREKCIVGFVGNLTPSDAGFAAQVARFAGNRLFRGIRIPSDSLFEGLAGRAFRDGLTRLADAGLTLDLNGPESALGDAVRLAKEFSTLKIVIDHVGQAGDAMRLSREWRGAMGALGQRPNVVCKISALMEQTEAASEASGRAPRDLAYYAPILHHCRECFGEDRIIYGSNWPVCERGGGYADQFRIVAEYFGARSVEEREKFFCKNARAVYGLG